MAVKSDQHQDNKKKMQKCLRMCLFGEKRTKIECFIFNENPGLGRRSSVLICVFMRLLVSQFNPTCPE